MHPALDRDVRVRDGSGKELAKRTEVEGIGGSNPSSPLNRVLQLLEKGVLKNGVDNQDQRREHTGEESLGTLLLKKVDQGRPSGLWLLGLGAREALFSLVLARRHAGVHDPDGVGDEHGSAARNSAGDHGLSGSELFRSASGFLSSLLESRARPLVPVVVDEVGHADAEKGGFQPGIQTAQTLALNDMADRIDSRALSALRFDLGAGRQSNEGIAVGQETLANRKTPTG